ncbi:MAG TPA: YciI family protein [Longimicrobium sp.]|nr:YciI family protein [Longimicrobium sp.]
MRFMIIRKADPETEAGVMPGEELITAMARYNQELADAGVLVGGDGLQPSSKGAKIKFSGGRPTITDGPFTEAKELIAGYTLIEVASKEEAIEWVKRWPPLDGHGNVELELRQVYELSDFGESEGLEHHARLREQIAHR